VDVLVQIDVPSLLSHSQNKQYNTSSKDYTYRYERVMVKVMGEKAGIDGLFSEFTIMTLLNKLHPTYFVKPLDYLFGDRKQVLVSQLPDLPVPLEPISPSKIIEGKSSGRVYQQHDFTFAKGVNAIVMEAGWVPLHVYLQHATHMNLSYFDQLNIALKVAEAVFFAHRQEYVLLDVQVLLHSNGPSVALP